MKCNDCPCSYESCACKVECSDYAYEREVYVNSKSNMNAESKTLKLTKDM